MRNIVCLALIKLHHSLAALDRKPKVQPHFAAEIYSLPGLLNPTPKIGDVPRMSNPKMSNEVLIRSKKALTGLN